MTTQSCAMNEGRDLTGAGRVEARPVGDTAPARLPVPDDAVRERFEQLIREGEPVLEVGVQLDKPVDPEEALIAEGETGAKREVGRDAGAAMIVLPPLFSSPSIDSQSFAPEPKAPLARSQRLAGLVSQSLRSPDLFEARIEGGETRHEITRARYESETTAREPAAPVGEVVLATEPLPALERASFPAPTLTLTTSAEIATDFGLPPVPPPQRSPASVHRTQPGAPTTPASAVEVMASVDGEPAFDGANPDDRPSESPNALGVTPLSLLPVSQAPLTLGPQGPAPAMAETTHSLPPGALTDWIQQTVSDLRVFEGNVGTSQVRLDIKPELLPGVRVIVQEAGGRIQVDFICSAESSRRLLGAVARREATDMARRCRRDLLLRVQSEEDDSNPRSGTDPDAVEIVAAA